jgi:hypothetical protein
MNQMVAIKANRFQILDSVAAAMRTVFAMVDLQAPVAVAAVTPSGGSSQNFKTMDLVDLGHQNAQRKVIGAMSRLGNQFIAAEGGIRNIAGAVSIVQPAHFVSSASGAWTTR